MSEHEQVPSGVSGNPRLLVKTGVLWAFGIGLATLMVVALGLMNALQLALRQGKPQITPKEFYEHVELPGNMSALNPDQVAQRQAYEARQHHLLSEYAWVDQKQKIARIPIERAMSLIVNQYGKTE
jgi:hypothetical protein